MLASGRPDDAIEQSAPIWGALGELFLDTELSASDHDRLASVIRSAGFGAAEAEAVLLREVAPALLPNLLSVAGAWAGWSDGDVRRIVTAHLRRSPFRRWLARTAALASRPLFWNDWTAVARRLHRSDTDAIDEG